MVLDVFTNFSGPEEAITLQKEWASSQISLNIP